MNSRLSHTNHFIQSKNAFFLTTAVLSAFLVSNAFLSNRLFLVLTFAGAIIYLRISIHIKILLLTLGALFPISFGSLGGIPHFYWFEWMAPLMAAMLAVNLSLFSRNRLLIKGNAWLYSVFLALIITVVVNYARNPVLAQKAMGVAEQAGGVRSYYDIAAGLCLTFVIIWYLTYYLQDRKAIRPFLASVAIFSISIGFLQLAAFFFKFQLPFLYSAFRFEHMVFGVGRYGGMAFRIGGLSECAVIGMSAILGLSYGKKLRIKEIFALGLCAILLILSGGRAYAGGALIVIAVYAGLSSLKRAMIFIIGGLCMIYIFWFLASSGYLGGQWERFATIGKGYEAVDQWRDASYHMMLDSIARKPIFGKGVGYVGTGSNQTVQFAMAQLKVGGHGAYLSILALFGIFGLYFLVTALTYGIIKGFVIVRRSISNESILAMFCLLLLIIIATSYFVSGNGYSDMHLYLCIGILAGLSRKGSSRKNEK